MAPKPSVKELLGTLEYGPAPEASSVVEAWLDDHGRSLGHFIGNQWVKPEGRKTYDSFNPATGERLATTIQGMQGYTKAKGRIKDTWAVALPLIRHCHSFCTLVRVGRIFCFH